MVTGSVAGFTLTSGLAYFDPKGRLDDSDPALKIILTEVVGTVSITGFSDPNGVPRPSKFKSITVV